MSISPAAMFKKVRIAAGPSIRPSSMQTSITCAPAATCARAISIASEKLPSRIRRANLALPATLHRSPMFMKLASGTMRSCSSPLTAVTVSGVGRGLGLYAAAIGASALMKSGLVPQHPPMMFTRERSA